MTLPECEKCRRSASGDRSHRWCPPGKSWPCVPLPPCGPCRPPANRNDWTRPCCGNVCQNTHFITREGERTRRVMGSNPVYFHRSGTFMFLLQYGYVRIFRNSTLFLSHISFYWPFVTDWKDRNIHWYHRCNVQLTSQPATQLLNRSHCHVYRI